MGSYKEFEKMLKSTMEETFYKNNNKGIFKHKLSEKAKKLKNEKRICRKEFESAEINEKKQKLEKYLVVQRELREEMERIEKENVQMRINKIIKEGGAKSDSFWK